MTGQVVRVKSEKKFAFIKPDGGGPDVFLFVSDLDGNVPFDDSLQFRRLEFELVETDRGPKAVNASAAT